MIVDLNLNINYTDFESHTCTILYFVQYTALGHIYKIYKISHLINTIYIY